MSGAVTYGPDSGGNSAEYSAYVANGARPVAYAAQLGQTPGTMPHGMVPQQMPMSGAGISPGFLPQSVGGPSMRESVEGIPQVHLQQQQQQQQAQQQQMHPGVPSTGIPGLPQHLAGGMPHYAMQTGMAMAGGQQYAAVGLPIQYYQVAHPGAPGFAQMVPNYQFGTAPQFMHGGEWEDEYDEGSGAVLYGNLEVKHRRRTTPEQLRVLEHWFEINPRPDNAMREWLASELGITKRNVQVWFQNRRAKIKQQEKAREAAAAESKKEQSVKAEGTGAEGASQAEGTPAATDANKSPATMPTPAAQSAQSGQSAQGTPVTGPAQVPIAAGQSQQQQQQPHSQPPSIQTTPAPATVPSQVPSRPSSSSRTHTPMASLLPTVNKIDMGRRVSIAGGDMASIEEWAIKRRQQMGHTSPHAPNTLSPANSPMGMAAAARRNSQPYPTQIITHHVGEDAAALSRSGLGSPKVSPNAPNGRTPGHLLFTAMRNNTIRRASMPGGAAQLISTTAFTPPRVSTYHSSSSESPSGRHGARELSPIKDQDYEIDPALRQVPMTFVTPPQNGAGNGSSELLNVPGTTDSSLSYTLNPGLPFSPNSPLPNPSFSFGGTPSMDTSASMPNMFGGDKMQSSGLISAEHDPNHALFMALQKGRLGSIASVNSVATNGTDATADYGSEAEWGSFMAPPGFDPDIRRASAPADLLHNIGLLGISGPSSQNPSPIRPSPLAAGYGGQQQGGGSHTYELNVPSNPVPGPQSAPIQSSSSSSTLGGGPYLPASNNSPTQSTGGGSQLASEGPSPSGTHTQINSQSMMMLPPPLPGQHQQQYQFPDMSQQQQQYAESSANLPPSFPNVPDPSAYTNPSGLPSSSGSSSGETLGTGNEFDLSFDFSTESDDKDQFSFLSDLTNESASADTVNVLV